VPGASVKRWCVAAAAVGLVIVGAAIAGAALLVRGGISARGEPSALESRIGRALRSWAIPDDAREAANPIAASPRVIADGLAHFADHCASCHANDGSGQTAMGRKLYPRAPDMRSAATQGLTDGELFYIIENGVRLTGMPAWGGPGTAEESWHLVHFIRHLPRLTPEEKAQMEALNPKSPDDWRALEREDASPRGEAPAARKLGHGSHSH
jgi:mono/diheme cytochrome c family protein